MKVSGKFFLLLSCLCWLSHTYVAAQVINDNIEQRLILKPDSVYHSSTVGCTVQKNCISQSLENNCVLFHNDQWFEFTPTISGLYFVNISSQNCRDIKGVQVLVLTGEPCQPKTYQIINCTSLGTQDDVYVQLDSLQAGIPYLLNIDGYLHDYCSFALEISQRPKGLPAILPPAPKAKGTENKVVALSWRLPDIGMVSQFQVLRREVGQARFDEIAVVDLKRDTYGNPVKEYAFTDTLKAPGKYLYLVVTAGSEDSEKPELLLQQWHYLEKSVLRPYVTLPLDKYPVGAELQVVVLDYQTGRLLKHFLIIKKKKTQLQERLYISDFQEAGLQKIRVRISFAASHKRNFVDDITFEIPGNRKNPTE